jgi:hypothetical protein
MTLFSFEPSRLANLGLSLFWVSDVRSYLEVFLGCGSAATSFITFSRSSSGPQAFASTSFKSEV